MSTVTAPAPASASEAMDMVHAGLAFLAAADAAAMGSAVQAAMLRGLEEANSVAVAARISVLGAFAAGQGYTDDGAYSPRAWLVHQTAVTHGAAAGHTGWVKRSRAHPRVHAALAARAVSEPWAKTICKWTARLPAGSQDPADGILLAAAASGLGLPDLAALAGEMYERSRQRAPDGDGPGTGGPGPAPDQQTGHDPAPEQRGRQDQDYGQGEAADAVGQPGRDEASGGSDAFDDRSVRLALTFGGAGVIRGGLTPECAQVVGVVLDALSARAGPEDDRSYEQRYHDALQEAMTRLVAAGLIPRRAGQPVKVWGHTTLADMMLLEGSERLRDEWIRQARARWAGYRSRPAEERGDDGAWLDEDAVGAIACDAMVAPVVWGQVNPSVFADLVRLSAELDKIYRRGQAAQAEAEAAAADTDGGAGAEAVIAREALEQAVIVKAVELLSGPGGLASFIRRRQFDGRLAGPSLPLDLGVTRTIPAHIRNLVRHRDRHCRFPGCRQPAAVCEVHHVHHKAHGGKTSLTNCVLLCRYHHQIAVHRQGWTLVLNADGTTTAWDKGRTRVLRSHGPPARAG
jgi:5-methylcytosine-specific restriction endonuclease McrA